MANQKSSSGSSNHVYSSQEPVYIRFPSRRSPVHSTKGMVSSTQPLASRAGIRILQQGGNAADAAVATAAALNMTEPCSTGIGGDMFCLYYDAKTKKTHAMNGSGRAGGDVTLESMRKDLGIPSGGKGNIPFTKVQAVTIPGAAAGWVDTIEKFGSGKVSMDEILKPAIELGEEGFPVSELSSYFWQSGEALLKKASPNYAEMLKPDSQAKGGCRAPKPGELFKNPGLAKTFRSVAEHGKKGFYEGRIAEEYVKVVQELGGRLTLEDLKHHAQTGSEEVEAISLKFEGQGIAEPLVLWEHPPNGQGLVALIALGIFQELERAGKIKKYSQKDHNSVEYIHALVESLRLAFSDGRVHIGDMDFTDIPIKALLSGSYLSQRAKSFNPQKAISDIDPGVISQSSSDTVYFSVADSEGNACSFIISNYAGFGTGIIPKGCGFTLQNRGANFVLWPEDHPNVLAPRKRPFHTIIPGMITRANDSSLYACFGVMGGYMQPQGHLQVLLDMAVFGLNPQEALDAPRICIEPASANDGKSHAGQEEVYLEAGIGEDVAKGLRKLGHSVYIVDGFERSLFGKGQVIRRSVDDGVGIWTAGSDLRGDGHASPL